MADLLHSKLQLHLVTPTGALVVTEADEVRAPGILGGFGVRPGHTAFLTELGGGVLTYVNGGQEDHYAVAGGFCEVAENRVTVLADFAEHARGIDPHEALEVLTAAQARLAAAAHKDLKIAQREEASVRIAAARLAAARTH